MEGELCNYFCNNDLEENAQWHFSLFSDLLHVFHEITTDCIENTVPLLQCNCRRNMLVCGAIT
jgi:hypothetical protein